MKTRMLKKTTVLLIFQTKAFTCQNQKNSMILSMRLWGYPSKVIFDQLMLGMINEEYLNNSSVEKLNITKDDLSTYAKFNKTVDSMEKSILKDIFSYFSVSEERYNELISYRSNQNDNETMVKMFADKEFSKKFYSNLINQDIYSDSNIEKITAFLTEDNIRKLSEPSMQIPLTSIDQKENLFNKEIFYAQVESFGLDKKIVDDAVDKVQQSLVDLSIKLAEYINLNIGISCFSEVHGHALMWSHYANKHMGFCVEYDMDVLIQRNPKIAILMFPVIYTNDRPIIDRNIISSFKINDGKLDASPNANKYFTRALVTKSRLWRYEKEWRVISKVMEDRIVNFDCVSGIYLGARASKPLIDYMKTLCSQLNIDLYQYSIDIKTYQLNLKNLYYRRI